MYRIWACVLVFVGALAAMAAERPSGMSCAQVQEDTARLACYDGVFRNGKTITKSTAVPPEIAAKNIASDNGTPKNGTAKNAAPEAEPVQEMTPEEAFGIQQTQRQKKETHKALKEINAHVTKISKRAREELVLELDNGQVWTQTLPRLLPVKVGDGVVVRRAGMGGYILTTERGASSRVKRLQ